MTVSGALSVCSVGAGSAAAAAVGSRQEESSTASSSGTRSHSQDRKSGRSPSPEEGSRRGKRKLDDLHEPDGERGECECEPSAPAVLMFADLDGPVKCSRLHLALRSEKG